jgi:AcrR family transcriptional regulator
MEEHGVGGLSVSEVARRMGVRGPSLYKYFPSLHAIYDRLFARGVAGNAEAVAAAVDGEPDGVAALRAGVRATVRWCVENAALAQLLYWRPVPGFEPSPEVFAPSVDGMRDVRRVLADAVRREELHPDADSDDAARLLTVILSGVISQQMANEPGAAYERGVFTRLTDDALDMFLARYRRK